MNKVFVDTSAWVALFDEDDAQHREAINCFENIKAHRIRMVISDFVFSESITTALGRAGHRIAVNVGDFILSSAIIDFIWLDESLKRKAWDYFKRHNDKKFSFTDCTSFVLMNDMNIKQYFAFDDHFKQAGFVEFS